MPIARYKWEDHFRLTEEEERLRIAQAVTTITEHCGVRPVGWCCRTGPSVHTRRLLVEEGFLYDSDAYNDDLPYWVEVEVEREVSDDGHVSGVTTTTTSRPHLVVPYSLVTNDSKFAPGLRGTAWRGEGINCAHTTTPPALVPGRAFSLASDFSDFMIDSLDILAEEGGLRVDVSERGRKWVDVGGVGAQCAVPSVCLPFPQTKAVWCHLAPLRVHRPYRPA